LILVKAFRRQTVFAFSFTMEGAMTADELYFLYLVIAAMALFGATLAWTQWYSNGS
jgi:hypothetical protein